jgi:hypothetical protein
MPRHVFLVSKDNPSFELEILEYDEARHKAKVRSRNGSYEVDWPGTEEVERKRRQNYRLEVRNTKK